MAKARSKRPNQPSARQLHEARIEEVRRSYDEIEAIMADPDVVIELLEQAGFTVSRPDEPAVPQSREPAAVAGYPSDDELLTLDQLRNSWNVQADAANSWDELGADEIVFWAQKQALNRWGRPAAPPAAPEGKGPSESDVADLFYRHMGEGSEVGFENAIAEALARWGGPTLQPVAASLPVTLATVGDDFYRNSPIACAAVRAAISEAELIRNLLENERRLTELVTDALHRAAPKTLMVHQSPAHLVLKPSPELMEEFEASLQPGRIKRLSAAAPAVGELSPREIEAKEAFARMRDHVLNGIEGLENDQINSVLDIIDDFTPDWV